MLKKVKICVWILLCVAVICVSFFFGKQYFQNLENTSNEQFEQNTPSKTDENLENQETPENPNLNDNNPSDHNTEEKEEGQDKWTDEDAVKLLEQSVEELSLLSEKAFDLPKQEREESTKVQGVTFIREESLNAIDKLIYTRYFLSLACNILHTANGGEYKLGQAVCGKASFTPNQKLNLILQNRESDPILTFYAEKENDGLSIRLDWDFRQKIFELYPKGNCVLTVTAKLKCDAKSKKVTDITMSGYYTGENGDFFSLKVNLETETFDFLEGKNSGVWSGTNEQVPFTEHFHGGLSYENLIKYPFEEIRIVHLSFDKEKEPVYVYLRQNPELILLNAEQKSQEEKSFSELYENAYEQVKDGKLRTETELISQTESTQTENFEKLAKETFECAQYVITDTETAFLSVRAKTMQTLVSVLLKEGEKNEILRSFAQGLANCLFFDREYYSEKLGKWNNKEYILRYNIFNKSEKTEFRTRCTKVSYQITDGVNELVFTTENYMLTSVSFNGISVSV